MAGAVAVSLDQLEQRLKAMLADVLGIEASIIDVDQAGRFLVRLVNHTPLNPVKVGIELTTMERIYLQYRGGVSSKT